MYKLSYLWRSLLAARELVQHGMALIIGDEKRARIGEDRWIDTENTHKITSVLPHELHSKSVCCLMYEASRRLNREQVESILNTHDAQQILALPLSYKNPKDRRVWRFTSTVLHCQIGISYCSKSLLILQLEFQFLKCYPYMMEEDLAY